MSQTDADSLPAGAASPVSSPVAGTWPPSGEHAGLWAADASAVTVPGGPASFVRLRHLRRRPGQHVRRSGDERRASAGWSADLAGALLGRITVLPAVLVVACLVPGLPLLLAGLLRPLPALVIAVPAAVALIVYGLRVVPSRWPRPLSTDRTSSVTTWFGLLATIAVVAGLTGWQLAQASAAVVVLRDQGTYFQAGFWIAQHGSFGIPEMLRAFGGPHAGLNFTSTGFLQRGTTLYPAVLPGLPILLAGGFWVHGTVAAAAVGPVLGGLATLAFAGLIARLAGPQWAPAGALVLGLSLPQQFVSRTTLSETALQILIFGGLCLLADSLVTEDRMGRPTALAVWSGRLGLAPTPSRMLAGLAGLALGFGLLLSLDALLYLLAVIPFACVLAVRHRPQTGAFLAGTSIGALYGLAGCYLESRPYLDTVGRTVAMAGVAAIWLVALSMVVLQLAKVGRVRAGVPRLLAGRPLRWLPEAGAGLAVAVLVAFAVRPYLQTVRGHPGPGLARFIGSLQRRQGLPVDPARLYSEQTLYWVIWYVGLPTVLLAALGLALLTRGSLRALVTGRDPAGTWWCWGLPLAALCAGSAAMLWAPSIVPDQPWASRRLIVMAIPAMILFALWAADWLSRWARERGAHRTTAALAGTACAAAMLVPTVTTTFGLGFSHVGGTGGLHPVAQGLALTRTGAGEATAVRALCAQVPRDAAVIIVDNVTAERFSQTVRGMCGVPVGWMIGQPASAVSGVIRSVVAAGRRPVLLASTRRGLAGFGGSPVRAVDLLTTQDPHELTQLPTAPAPVRFQVWLSMPVSGGSGA